MKWILWTAISITLLTGCAHPVQEPAEECSDGVCTPPPQPKQRRPIWANSYLWHKAPDLDVAQWLTEQPELKDKFVIIEFWRTWCSSCKRMTSLMNELHEKYKDDLVIIAITGETPEAVNAYKGPKKNYFMALDKPNPKPVQQSEYESVMSGRGSPDVLPEGNKLETDQGVFEAQFGVYGWPHIILLEPQEHVVIWEGFPGVKGQELTVETVGRYIERGRQ